MDVRLIDRILAGCFEILLSVQCFALYIEYERG